MKVTNNSFFVLFICGFLYQSSVFAQPDVDNSDTIPSEGNSWSVNSIDQTRRIFFAVV